VGGLVENAYSIENYPGLEPTSGPVFGRLLAEHIARFGVELVVGEVQAIGVKREGFALTIDPLGEVRAGAVILATGTAPRRLEVPGAADLEGDGLHYEVRDVLVPTTPERSLVVGGGEAALDYALSLARDGSEVTVCVRREVLRARGRLVKLTERSPNVEFRFEVQPVAIGRAGGEVKIELETPGGRVVERSDVVVAAVGRIPRGPELFKGLDLPPSQALSAGLKGLFVAGDVRRGALGQAGMAVGDGLAAAMAAVAYLEEAESKR